METRIRYILNSINFSERVKKAYEKTLSTGQPFAIYTDEEIKQMEKSMTDTTADQAPILEVAEAVTQTMVDPSLPMLAEDLVLVHKLVNEVRTQLAGKHPSVMELFHFLFHV